MTKYFCSGHPLLNMDTILKYEPGAIEIKANFHDEEDRSLMEKLGANLYHTIKHPNYAELQHSKEGVISFTECFSWHNEDIYHLPKIYAEIIRALGLVSNELLCSEEIEFINRRNFVIEILKEFDAFTGDISMYIGTKLDSDLLKYDDYRTGVNR